jgi:subtilase family serine protease
MSGWMVFGGTSVASPSLAGVVNLANHPSSSTTTANELSAMYTYWGSTLESSSATAAFRDITSGTAGRNKATTGWDFVTGLGSPLGTAGK